MRYAAPLLAAALALPAYGIDIPEDTWVEIGQMVRISMLELS